MRTVVTLQEDEISEAVKLYIEDRRLQPGYGKHFKYVEFNHQTTTTNKAFLDVVIEIEDDESED